MSSLEKLTLRAVLEKSTQSHSARPALARVDGESLTYAIVYNRIQALAQQLSDRGMEPGDRIAILSENKPNWAVAFFAITTSDGVAVPIDIETSALEIKRIIRQCACKIIFISLQMLEYMGELNIKPLETIIQIENFQIVAMEGKKDFFKELIGKGEKEWGRLKKAALQMAGKIYVKSQPEIAVSDTAAIFYSPQTGLPVRAVMLTHQNLICSAQLFEKIVSLNEHDRFLSRLPLSRSVECALGLIAPFIHGCCVYYLEEATAPNRMVDALNKVKPTLLLIRPNFLETIYREQVEPQFRANFFMQLLLRLKFFKRKRWQKIGRHFLEMFGGQLRLTVLIDGTLSEKAQTFLNEIDFPYSIGYGLTETTALIAATKPYGEAGDSVGQALPDVELKIDQPDPETGEGDILVHGAVVMKGYFQDAPLTAQVLSADGWLRTDDRGRLDANGNLYLKG